LAQFCDGPLGGASGRFFGLWRIFGVYLSFERRFPGWLAF
jgi:hypothetical protein